MFKNLVTATESVDVNLTDSDMTSISTEVLNVLLSNQMASACGSDAYFGLKSDLMSAKNLLSILSETSDPTSVLAVANGAGDISTISPAYESFLQGTTALTPNLDAVKGELSAAIAAGDVALEGFWKDILGKFTHVAISILILVGIPAAIVALLTLGPLGFFIAGGISIAALSAITIGIYMQKCKVAKAKLKAEDDARLKEIESIENVLLSYSKTADIKLHVHKSDDLLLMIHDCIHTYKTLDVLLSLDLPDAYEQSASFWSELDSECNDDLKLFELDYDNAGHISNDDFLTAPKTSGDMKSLGYGKNIEEVINSGITLKEMLGKMPSKKYIADINKKLKLKDKQMLVEVKKWEALPVLHVDDENWVYMDIDDAKESYMEYKYLIERFIKASSKLLTETTRQLKLIDDTWVVKIEDPMGILK